MGHRERTKSKEPSERAIRTTLQGESTVGFDSIYVIKAGREVIWEGRELQKAWPEIRKDLPAEKLTITWKTPPGFLIV